MREQVARARDVRGKKSLRERERGREGERERGREGGVQLITSHAGAQASELARNSSTPTPSSQVQIGPNMWCLTHSARTGHIIFSVRHHFLVGFRAVTRA
eukprot:3660712-Rhodomonas_salina.4